MNRGPGSRGLAGRLSGALPALLLSLLLLAPPVGAKGGAAFEPAGTLLEGTERQPVLGKTPVTFHLAPDGSAAAALLDPEALAIGWTGGWSEEEGLLVLDLDPVQAQGDPVRVELRVKGSGKGKGTVTRFSTQSVVTKVKVKAVHPPPRARGWTAVLPRIRDTGGTAAGEFRGTLVLRNLAPPGRKPRPARVALQAVSPAGLPGRPSVVEILPGATLRLAGGALPRLPAGAQTASFQVLVSGDRSFDPSTFEVLAFEETLRGFAQPATSGTPLEVLWVRGLRRSELRARETAPLAAPFFRDDGGLGALPRDARLVLRDLAPLTGDPATGAVRVSVRTPAGAEVAAADVPLPRGAAVELRPRDLLASPGDLPDGEGQIRVTAADGGDLPRGVLGAALLGTVTSAGTPVASLSMALGHPEREGRTGRIAAPRVFAPADGSGTTRIVVLSLAPSPISLPVAVLAPDGTGLHATLVPCGPGAAVRVDPEALGMDLSLLPGGEGQVVVGSGGGIPVHRFLAHGEGRFSGSPDTFFPGPVGFETAPAPGAPVRVDLVDALETLGSDPGDRDALLYVRNGAATPLSLVFRAFGDGAEPVGDPEGVPVTIAPGESLGLSVEALLAQAGAPLFPEPDAFRGSVALTGTAVGPLAVLGIQFRRSATALGGYALRAAIR